MGIALSHRAFFEKLIETDDIPKTSQISEYRFTEAFEELTKDGSEVIAVVLSSKLSGTCQSAVKASKKFEGKVFVVDSMNACLGERILVEYAARLIEEGKFSARDCKVKALGCYLRWLLGCVFGATCLSRGGELMRCIGFSL